MFQAYFVQARLLQMLIDVLLKIAACSAVFYSPIYRHVRSSWLPMRHLFVQILLLWSGPNVTCHFNTFIAILRVLKLIFAIRRRLEGTTPDEGGRSWSVCVVTSQSDHGAREPACAHHMCARRLGPGRRARASHVLRYHRRRLDRFNFLPLRCIACLRTPAIQRIEVQEPA